MAEILIKKGKKYNIFDKINNVWNQLSIWTHADDVEFSDGKTASTKVGALNGITSDLSCEDESIAISAKAVNDSLNSINTNLTDNLSNTGHVFRFAEDGEGNGGYLKADGSFVPFSKGILGDVVTYKQSTSTFSIAFSKDIKAICISGTIYSATNVSGQKLEATAVTESGTLYSNNVTSDIQAVTSGLSYYSSGNIIFMFKKPPLNDGSCKITLNRYLYGATISCLY